MLRVSGRMVVNERHSAWGAFNVGILYSSLGDFAVKYDGLDEFNEGSYSGEFVISCTYQRTRKFLVGVIVEPVAEIGAIHLDEAEEGEQEEIPPAIPDPLEEELEAASLTRDAPAEPSTKTNAPASEDESVDLDALFGDLWPFGNVVKLDPTIGRARFRQQRDYLKANGYRFESKEQIWVAANG